MTMNFLVEPYYDDYDKHKHFYKILYRPAYSLQTRELTQMQSILQDQVARMGDHIFKNGTMVIPGELSFDNEFHYIKLNAIHNSISVSTFITSLKNLVIVGGTSGAKAQVVEVAVATSTDPDTIFVKYLSSGTSGTFIDNETIAPEDITFSALAVTSQGSSSTGIGSSAAIKEGVYYIDGYFVLCEPQLILLDKYTSTPSYSIGFNITETIVTPEMDETLLDNAQGSYNYAAPGAHRYSISLELTKKTDIHDTNDTTKYIQLVELVSGKPTSMYNQTQYAELAKVMARRTYDESGDYVVSDFKYSIRDHRNNDRGIWAASKAYLIGDIVTHGTETYKAEINGTSGSLGIAGTWPTSKLVLFDDGGVTWRWTTEPKWNNGLYAPENGGNENKFSLGIEAGKAYVRGYEIEKVSTSYLDIDKARTIGSVDNSSNELDVGNFIEITNVHGLPDIINMPVATLYNAMTTTEGLVPAGVSAVVVGTARVRYFELRSGTIGSASAVYRLGLFNVIINSAYDFKRDVKQVYIFNTDTNHTFTADVNPVLVPMIGTVTSTSTTLTGTGTSFTSLKFNDVISIGGINYRVTTTSPITSNDTIAVTPAPSPAITAGVSYSLITTTIIEPQNSNLIFQIGNNIKSIRNLQGLNVITYSTLEQFTATTDGAGDAVITIPYGGGNIVKFASGNALGNYIGVYSTGLLKDLQGLVTLTSNDQTATLHFGGAVLSQSVTVIVTLNKTGSVGTEKQKVATYTTNVPATEAIGTARTIVLPKADVIKITSVKMKSGTWTAPTGGYTIDITNRYTLDTGQTDSYYDLGKVILIDGQKAPIAPIEITFKYHAHVGTGDYFSVNSYDIPYKHIERFADFELKDCLDFRPRVSDDGLSFSGTGGSKVSLPKRGYNLTSAYDYYLGRIDKLCVEPSGDFHVIVGTPSVSPTAPASSPSGMLLNTITIQPYTPSVNSVRIESVDNRRYTMRDIGKLETRIANLEYYTTLSLTEQDTSNMSITDSTGLNRYKNGFIVDSFNGHGIGDATSPDYLCSIDAENKTLRSFHSMKNITLYEMNTSNRSTNHYVMTGDLVTLPYTHRIAINQGFASRTENVNPFAVYAWVGSMNINPESDDWFEGKQLPNIVNNVEGNYNTLLQSYTQSGQLGTVWNAWQNIWYGAVQNTSNSTAVTSSGGSTSVNTKKISDRRRISQNGGWNRGSGNYGYWQAFTTTTTTTSTSAKTATASTTRNYAQQIGQTRTGLNTTVTPTIDTQLVGDSVVSRTVIPYMRSRNVAFLCYGLKSGSRMFGYFDTSPVDAYITPATILTITNAGGVANSAITNGSNIYDIDSNAGSDANNFARQIGDKLDLALNRGFIVSNQTRYGTAIVLYQEPLVSSSNFTNLRVINIKGSFVQGDSVIGSLNGGSVGSTGTVTTAPAITSEGSVLTANYAGVICGTFRIPNNSKMTFKTGDRELAFLDTQSGYPTTSAFKSYHAIGIFAISQATYLATRNASVVQTAVSQSGVITPAWSTVSSSSTVVPASTSTSITVSPPPPAPPPVRHRDPLAQTFIIDTAGGAFITKIDLFFSTKETKLSTPVCIEIRDVVNGTPATRVLPFSTVNLDPSAVNVSATGTIATTFTFKSPVYLQDSQEYAIVILSDSNNYNVFISQMGEIDIATNKMISTQPTLGVLFKSSNGSSWNSNQLQDLKFNLHRASFDMVNTGYVNFTNSAIDAVLLPTNPIHITNGSNLIRITHPNHCMPAGSSVTISGATTVGNITDIVLNVTSVISNVDHDSYTIAVTGPAASSTTEGGGTIVYATENVQYDTLYANTSELIFQNTSIEYAFKSTTGQSVDGSEVAYIKDSSFKSIASKTNVEFSSPRMIASTVNESISMASVKSFEMQATLKTTKENLSPVIDVQRLSLALVQNKLNAPTLANTNVDAIDDVTIISTNKIAFDAVNKSIYIATSGNAAELALMQRISVGRYINISGDVTNVPTSHPAHNGNWLVTGTETIGANFHVHLTNNIAIVSVASGTNTITVVQHERFIDEICPMYGSAFNKYISREIVLAQPSTYLKIKLAANVPPLANVEVYYRINPVGASSPISSLIWTLATPSSTIQKTSNGSYNDISFDIQNLSAFDTMQAKIVLTSASTSQTPSCMDLRIIAAA